MSQVVDAPEASVIAGATHEIENLYEQQVVPTCRALIANRYPFASPTQPDVQLGDFAAVFGYDGLFDRFFTVNLEKQVDTTHVPWTWRPGSVSPTRQLLDQFLAARRVRDMFFVPGSKTPEVRFGVTFRDLDPSASRFILQIDGQILDDTHQPPTIKPAVWPGPTPGQAASSFESRYFDPTKSHGGPWAWFRMIDATMDGPPDGQQLVRLSVQNRYHRVNLTVETSRAGDNPFATRVCRQFNCES